jgi:hypothetical protein
MVAIEPAIVQRQQGAQVGDARPSRGGTVAIGDGHAADVRRAGLCGTLFHYCGSAQSLTDKAQRLATRCATYFLGVPEWTFGALLFAGVSNPATAKQPQPASQRR